MKVNEIFKSIEGEGMHAGKVTTFIRLQGCNLKCLYCDTQHAGDSEGGTQMSRPTIMSRAICNFSNHVSITGGEPLLHEELPKLVVRLLREYRTVHIETNGSISIPEFFKKVQEHAARTVAILLLKKFLTFSIDYKLPSSGHEMQMLAENFEYAAANSDTCSVKFIAGTQEDLWQICDVIREYKLEKCFVGPAFQQLDPQEIVNWLVNLQDKDVQGALRLQLQLHKIIWDPEKRGV